MKNFDFFITYLTLSIIALYLYFIISKNHDTISLHKEDIIINFDFFLYLFAITAIIFFVFIILLFIKPKPKSRFWLQISIWVSKLNIFYKTYGIIFNFLGPMNTQHLVFFARRFVDWQQRTKVILILLFVTLPRVIIIIIFIIELYVKELHYYFYSLILLLIPLFFRFFVFMLSDVGSRVLPELREYIEVDNNLPDIIFDLPSGKKQFKPIGLKFKPEYHDMHLGTFLYHFYYPMLFISGEMEVNFKPKYTVITKITVFIYLTIHLLAWSYLLFIVL